MRNRFGADIPLQTAASTKSVKKHFENLVKKVWNLASVLENFRKMGLTDIRNIELNLYAKRIILTI